MGEPGPPLAGAGLPSGKNGGNSKHAAVAAQAFFKAIRHLDVDGNEFGLALELGIALGYRLWWHFLQVIGKARTADVGHCSRANPRCVPGARAGNPGRNIRKSEAPQGVLGFAGLREMEIWWSCVNQDDIF